MNMNITQNILLAAALFVTGIVACYADMEMDKRVAMARSAAPAAISDDATIIVDGKVVVEGSNGWTCMPEDGAASCNDAVWMQAMKAIGSKADFQPNRVGISYMLQGEPAGLGVSNSDPFHPNPQKAEDYVETGPHLMIIVPRHLLKDITDDPSSGGPYVMWGDTPYAHIMVPVTDSK